MVLLPCGFSCISQSGYRCVVAAVFPFFLAFFWLLKNSGARSLFVLVDSSGIQFSFKPVIPSNYSIMKLAAAIGGLAGACALTLINQLVSKVDRKAPRLDLLGMNAVAKFVKSPAGAPQIVQKLFPMSLAGDLFSNTLYYAMAGGGSRKSTLVKGALLGLGAGLGAVALPKPMGLD